MSFNACLSFHEMLNSVLTQKYVTLSSPHVTLHTFIQEDNKHCNSKNFIKYLQC